MRLCAGSAVEPAIELIVSKVLPGHTLRAATKARNGLAGVAVRSSERALIESITVSGKTCRAERRKDHYDSKQTKKKPFHCSCPFAISTYFNR